MKMRDRSAIWIGLADLLLCVLSVVIVAVAPTKAKVDGVKSRASFLISADWPVERDNDVDLWVVGPSGKPIMYAAREVGCGFLDHDSRGSIDGQVTLADGSRTYVQSYKETTTLRCIEPGRWTISVMLYSSHEQTGNPNAQSNGLAVPVHIEIVGLNPRVSTLFAKDVTLDRVGQSINVTSFDLDRDGKLTLADAPLESVTDRWLHRGGGYPASGAAP